MRKGDTIGAFLKAVREQCAPQFRELRAVSVDNMMYIKVRVVAGQHCHLRLFCECVQSDLTQGTQTLTTSSNEPCTSSSWHVAADKRMSAMLQCKGRHFKKKWVQEG